MGIVLKRRDNANIVKKVDGAYGDDVVDYVMQFAIYPFQNSPRSG